MSGFRVDIQALRGYAIILVLFYHAELGIFEGGFLGVDVFFVISGFLITGLIIKEIERGNFKFSRFYWRRAKRLLPAAYVVFLFTALSAPFILNAQELKDFSQQMLGAVTFSANIVLLMQSGYFAGAADLKPLLHVWSLSIEEQYYLFLPALLLFMPRSFLKVGICMLVIVSFGLCLIGLENKPEWTFYLLPTRCWELGIGSIGALFPLQNNNLCKVLFWPSLLILIIIPVFPTGLPHPGVDAILVCLATLIVIYRKHSQLSNAIAVKALAGMGDVSYSLYLTHWPIFAFLKNAAVGPLTWQLSVSALTLGVLLGLMLYLIVEAPIRQLQIQPSLKMISGGLVASSLLILVPIGILQIPTNGPDFSVIRRPNDGLSKNCTYETMQFMPKAECRTSENPSILVWGDSYAMHLVNGIVEEVSPEGVVQATMGVCGPFVNLAPISDVFYLRPWAEACLKFNDNVLHYLGNTKSITTVVLSSPFKQYLVSADGKHHWRGLRKSDASISIQDVGVEAAVIAMNETIHQLQAIGVSVVIVSPPPTLDFNIGACVERKDQGKLVLGSPTADCSIPVDMYRDSRDLVLRFLLRVKNENNIKLVSFDPILCDDKKCNSQIESIPVYIDNGHLTQEASVVLIKKLNFKKTLIEAMDNSGRKLTYNTDL